jgi:predicted alpha/beta-fold hydrolase
MTTAANSPRRAIALARFFKTLSRAFADHPFKPHPLFKGGDAQTLAAFAWPRKYRLHAAPADVARFFDVEPGVRVLAHCRWQSARQTSPTMIIWHGMEGSTSSIYMIAMADKAFRKGFNVVRVNFRNCGGTEHLTTTLYHGGLTSDLRFVIDELIHQDELKRLFLVGFSLGGNILLKLAGEYSSESPAEVIAVCAISPSVDLLASTDSMQRRRNRIYHASFLRRLKRRIKTKHNLYPDLYDITNLAGIRSIRGFDERYTSLANGFENATDYYYRSSALRVADQIRVPTLIIHAQDDPFIPYHSLLNQVFTENPYVMTQAPARGGHVAFIAAQSSDEDRFWAENRAIEFCQLADAELTSEFS